jgi:hypothetical protein
MLVLEGFEEALEELLRFTLGLLLELGVAMGQDPTIIPT